MFFAVYPFLKADTTEAYVGRTTVGLVLQNMPCSLTKTYYIYFYVMTWNKWYFIKQVMLFAKTWHQFFVLLNSCNHPPTLELRRTYLMNLRSQTPSVAYQKWTYPLTEFIWWGSQSWNPKFLITSPCHFDKNQNHFGLGCSQGSRELVFVLNNSSSTIC